MCNKIFFFLVLLVAVVACNQGAKKEIKEKNTGVQDSLKINKEVAVGKGEIIHSFVKAYVKKDAKSINEMIHPDLGLAIIFRPGVSDKFYHVDSLDFKKSVPEHYAYMDVKDYSELKYESLPVFDCAREKWNKEGFYCDTNSVANQLTQIVLFEKEFNPNSFPNDYIQKIMDLEKDSYRVVLTGDNPLIFHIKEYEGRWYITVLDRAYAGCDA